MSVGELLGYAADLVGKLGLSSYVVALAIISVAVSLLNRLFDR